METVQVGVVRDSMLANPLLIRSELGRSRPRGFSLPGQDFVYGRINPNRDGGVPEAMSHWVTVVPTSLPGSSSRKMGKDFVALNREAVKSGLVTAQEHYQYRATHDIPRRSPAREGSRLRRPRAPPDVTFGISTRPSTPIFELLEHRYAQRWLEEQQSAERAKLASRQKKQAQLGKIYETRTSLLRQSQPSVEFTSLWKLPRFQKVRPHLDTFQEPESRRRALGAHGSDPGARRGHLGHGTHGTG
ncbi:cilia- and flagella-associated protein 77 isoform X1 [Lepisosteus oculatus]|uniref:cilia- and flagella-associated protein 77 isoform X1 n=1 Tax=Lepisosteus oculatus TaxID=7918 RepID=UPI003711E433